MRRWMILPIFLLVPLLGRAETLYLCKAYSGGTFWSSVSCGLRQATVDRMVSVPDDIPWKQKVALGRAAEKEGRDLAAPPAVHLKPLAQTVRARTCARILAGLESVDARAGSRQATVSARQRKRLESLEERRQRLQC